MAKSSPLERTSVQIMIGAALLALLANSAVDQTDDKLPWEVTLTGFCLFAVVFAAIYAKRTEVAVSIVTVVGMIVPTYFVHYMEVPCSNWLLGSQFPLAAPPKGDGLVLRPLFGRFLHPGPVGPVRRQLG